MSGVGLFFRFRIAIMVLLHVIGFVAPWAYFANTIHGPLWLAAPTLIARTGWLDLATATVTITLLGLACLVAGATLRVWGSAYMVMQGDRLVSAGPYAYLRNPLYLGLWLVALATSLLMPPDGAAVFLIGYSGFLLFLIAAEEQFLPGHLGEPYLQYRRKVPRLLPRFTGQVGGSAGQPHWVRAILDEAYPIGFTLCCAVFASRYNARILIRCLLICYGVSLVLRALNGTAIDTTPGLGQSRRDG